MNDGSRIWNSLRDVRATADLLRGLAQFGIGRATPEQAYQGMVRLFCRSGGWSNDILSRGISAIVPATRLPSASGMLGDLSDTKRLEIRTALDRNGYFVFDRRLDDAICDRLLELSLQTPSLAQNGGPNGEDVIIRYERSAPRAVRYELDTSDLLANPDVQTLIADWSFIAVAQDYLRTIPILDIVTMWWHTAFSDHPDARAAQLYHFDMDRPRWLKFFVYLTDVETENGPHCFVRGSHRTGGIPRELLSRGYARHEDKDVERHFPPADRIRFIGRKGTVIAEDTRGLHKGQHVQRGDRLVLQLEFANSLFGGRLTPLRLGPTRIPVLAQRLEDMPRTYSLMEKM
jgi:hypothetical protein